MPSELRFSLNFAFSMMKSVWGNAPAIDWINPSL
jgi:hypothetical protein